MPQISFTKNNEQVYGRFSRLLLEEQLKRGKLTAPQFLDLVLDGFELLQLSEKLNYSHPVTPNEEINFVVRMVEGSPRLFRVTEWEREGSAWVIDPQNETE